MHANLRNPSVSEHAGPLQIVRAAFSARRHRRRGPRHRRDRQSRHHPYDLPHEPPEELTSTSSAARPASARTVYRDRIRDPGGEQLTRIERSINTQIDSFSTRLRGGRPPRARGGAGWIREVHFRLRASYPKHSPSPLIHSGSSQARGRDFASPPRVRTPGTVTTGTRKPRPRLGVFFPNSPFHFRFRANRRHLRPDVMIRAIVMIVRATSPRPTVHRTPEYNPLCNSVNSCRVDHDGIGSDSGLALPCCHIFFCQAAPVRATPLPLLLLCYGATPVTGCSCLLFLRVFRPGFCGTSATRTVPLLRLGCSGSGNRLELLQRSRSRPGGVRPRSRDRSYAQSSTPAPAVAPCSVTAPSSLRLRPAYGRDENRSGVAPARRHQRSPRFLELGRERRLSASGESVRSTPRPSTGSRYYYNYRRIGARGPPR